MKALENMCFLSNHAGPAAIGAKVTFASNVIRNTVSARLAASSLCIILGENLTPVSSATSPRRRGAGMIRCSIMLRARSAKETKERTCSEMRDLLEEITHIKEEHHRRTQSLSSARGKNIKFARRGYTRK